MTQLIRDLAECERPYEKAKTYGIETLSDAELLAVIIRTGTKEIGAIGIANMLLNLHPSEKGLLGLNYLTRKELLRLPGVGDTKATQLLAVKELSGRMRERSFRDKLSFCDPKSVGEYYLQKCRFLTTEHVFVLMLTSAMEMICERALSVGTVDHALISPRDIYIEAIRYEAASIILVHNHPSGNPLPSKADLSFTDQVRTAGKLLDIRLADHVIVGRNSYVSLRETGCLEAD